MQNTQVETTFHQLAEAAQQWAKDRNFKEGATITGQCLKLLEEAGELVLAHNKKKPDLLKDALGDTLVVICVLALLSDSKLGSIFGSVPNIGKVEADHMNADFEVIKLIQACTSVAMIGVSCANEKYIPYSFKQGLTGVASYVARVALLNGLTVTECLKAAYLEIKDRKGMMRDGKFIKQADLDAEAHEAALRNLDEKVKQEYVRSTAPVGELQPGCSSLCHPEEPCMVTDSGACMSAGPEQA